MGRTRRTFSDAERIKVGLEAIKGNVTQSQICSQYGVQASQISAWKKQLLSHLESTFSGDSKIKKQLQERDDLVDRLYKEVGKLKVENDFLKKKSAELKL